MIDVAESHQVVGIVRPALVMINDVVDFEELSPPGGIPIFQRPAATAATVSISFEDIVVDGVGDMPIMFGKLLFRLENIHPSG